MRHLLDTHVLLWWFEEGDRLSPAQRRLLGSVRPERPLGVSSISLWEVATLVHLGRVALSIPLREWLEKAVSPPLVQRIGISAAVAAEVARLPKRLHRDPADRILVATAKVHGLTLVTQDQRLLEAGLVPTLG